MDAKICDKCFEYYIPIKYDSRAKNVDGRPIINITAHTFGIERSYDLCPKCGDEFRDWLGRGITEMG